MPHFLPLVHARFKRVQTDLFVLRLVPDCMVHRCLLANHDGQERLDACCQYGADTDLGEQKAILARASLIAPYLDNEFQDPAGWFDTSAPQVDDDFPSGGAVRTAQVGDRGKGGCVFLQQSERGCAIHRASLEHGFALGGVKPMVCRLFPITFGGGDLLLSDDYNDYSCANPPDGPTLYRLTRSVLADVFDTELVAELDQAETTVLRGELRPISLVVG